MTPNELYNSTGSESVTLKFNPNHELGQVTVIVNRKQNKLPMASSDQLFDWLSNAQVRNYMTLKAGGTVRTTIPHTLLAQLGAFKGVCD